MAAQAVLHKKLFGVLKETGLSQVQPKVLDYLKEHDGANQKEIACGRHIEPPSLTSVLNRMEERGIKDAFVSLEKTAFHNISEEE